MPRSPDTGPDDVTARPGQTGRLVPNLLTLSGPAAGEQFELRLISVVARPVGGRSGIGAAGTLHDVGRAPRASIAEAAVVELSRAQLEALAGDIERVLGKSGAGDVDADSLRLATLTTKPDPAAGPPRGAAEAAAIEAASALKRAGSSGWPAAFGAAAALALAGGAGLALTNSTTEAPIAMSWAASAIPDGTSSGLPRLASPQPASAAPTTLPASRQPPPPALSNPVPPPLLAPAPVRLAAVEAPRVAVTPPPLPPGQDATVPAAASLAATVPAAETGRAVTLQAVRAIRATQDAWVKLSDARGTIFARRLLRPGETIAVPSVAGIRLTTGNAGGTELLVDGVASGPLGRDGAVIAGADLDTLAPR